MIYEKLPVSFLMALASEKAGSATSAIARTLLENLDAARGMNIKELAALCHTAPSSISRFCREVGFEGYAELREALETVRMRYERPSASSDPRRRAEDYLQKVAGSLRDAAGADLAKVRRLCEEIARYPRVAAFGLLKAEAAAIGLQCDLLMLGRQIRTSVSYGEQLQYIASAGADDLILLFSCTGSYFEYQELGLMREKLMLPHIWMVSGEEKPREEYIDGVILYRSHAQAGHPYQLQFIAGLIAQEYAAMLDERGEADGDRD